MSDLENGGTPHLRCPADDRLQQQLARLPKLSAEETAELVQELEVRRIALQRQCEELRASQRQWERSGDRLAELDEASLDLAQRKQVEALLRASGHKYRLLYENSMDAVFLTRSDGTILAANPAACQMFGMAEEEICRRGREGLIDPENPHKLAALEERVRTGRARSELTFVRKDGTKFLAEACSALLEGGAWAYVILHDISERRRYAEQIVRQNAVLSGIARIFHEALTCQTEEELGRLCLAVAEEVTQSKFGFIAEFNPQTGQLEDIAISDPGWILCRMPAPSGQGERRSAAFASHEIFGRVLVDRKGFFTNAPASHPDSIGSPAGHPPLTALLGVPLIHKDKTVGVIGLGNREGGYRQDELEAVEALAPAIVQAYLSKRAKEALRQSEVKYRRLHESMTDAFVSVDMEGRILECNDSYRKMLGYAPEELATLCYQDVTPEKWHSVEEGIVQKQVLVRGYSEPYEKEYRKKDGTVFPVELRTFLIRDDNDRPSGMWAIVRDITERKRAEEALRESEERFRVLVQSTAQAVWETNAEGVVVTDSPSWRAFTGQSIEEWLGYGGLKVVHPEDREYAARHWGETVAAGRALDVEYRLRRADGSWQWTNVHAAPLRNSDGSVKKWVGMNVDVTERKQAEAQLKILNDSLEQRVKERAAEAQWRANQLQRLAAQMTQTEERERRRLSQVLHDGLQQVLVAAKLRLGAAERRVQDAQARDKIRQAYNLVDEAIAESRSLTKELSPPVLYDGGLAAGLEWLGNETEKKYQLPVTVEVAPDMEPDDLTTKVFIFQAARELLLNAVKHAQASSLKISLSKADESRLQVVVEDDGTGFDAELRNGKEEQGGFGLFSIRERLDVIGGQLTIVSTPLEGTKARIVAPCRRSRQPSRRTGTARKQPDVPPHAHPSATNRIRILLADDHPALRKGLADTFREHPDFNLVGEAGDGHEALALALQTRPDVVLMDITMPRMDGIEATRQLKEEMPNVCVIGLSMHETEEMVAAMMNAGASEYLTKTIPTEDMLDAILKACPRR